jgi:hypothetical protein
MSEELSKEFVIHTKNVLPDWYDGFSEEAWRHTVKYIDSIQVKIDAKDKEIADFRVLLLKSSSHLGNLENITVTKWGVEGLKLIVEITKALEETK